MKKMVTYLAVAIVLFSLVVLVSMFAPRPEKQVVAYVPPAQVGDVAEESSQAVIPAHRIFNREGAENRPVQRVAARPASSTVREFRTVRVRRSASGTEPGVNLDDYRIDLNKLKNVPSGSYTSGRVGNVSGRARNVRRTRTGVSNTNANTAYTYGGGGTAFTARTAPQDRATLAREKILKEFASPATREQQEKLTRQLSGISDGVHRAIAQALVPKGKKQTNIEKYLARSNGEPVPSSNPFDSVVKQVSGQKAGVVSSMASSFGSAAGKQAGQIMDSFANEMSQAVNAPNQTPQEIAAKTKAINDKYQKKLQKFSQQQASNKALRERMAEDNKLKEQLNAKYGSKVGAQLGQVIDEYRQKELALAKEPLSAEEYHRRLSQLHIEQEDASRRVLQQNNQSAAAYNEVREQQTEERLRQMGEAIESGQKLEQRMTDSQRNYILQDSRQQTENIARQMEQTYGPEVAQQVRDLQREYEERLNQNMTPNKDGSERSMHEIELANNKARQEMNRRLQEIGQNAGVQKAVNDQMDKVMSSPQMQNLPDKQRRELESRMRPVYEEMFRTMAQNNGQGGEEAQRRAMQQLQEIMQQVGAEQGASAQ